MSVAENIPTDLRTVAEAAKETGVPDFIIRRRVKAGRLRGFTRRDRLYVSVAEVRAYDSWRPYDPSSDTDETQ